MAAFPFAKNRPAAIHAEAPAEPAFVWPVPLDGCGIRAGTKLTVRESLCAAVVAEGKVADVFGPGRHVLTAERLPALAKIAGWGAQAPSAFKAQLFCVHTKVFSDLPWSVDAPACLDDGTGGRLGLRAAGSYSVKVADAEAFLRRIFESNQIHDTAYLLGWQRSRLNVALAELCRERFGGRGMARENARERAGELAVLLEERARESFAGMGLELLGVRIEALDFPAENEAEEATAEGGAKRPPAAGGHFAGKSVQVTEAERLLLVSGEPPKSR